MLLASSHLPSSLTCPPLHVLIDHELYCWVEDEDERGQSAIPQSSQPLTGYDLRESICERKPKHSRVLNTYKRNMSIVVIRLRHKCTLTKYALVMGLLNVFISEFCPLQLQSSVDHPHGSSQDHVHCTCVCNR